MPSRSRSRSRDRHKRSRHRSRSRSRSRNSRSPHRHHRSRGSPDRHRSSRRSRSRSRDRQRREDSRHRSTDHHREQQHHDADRGHPRSRWEPHDAPREQRNGRGWEPDPRDSSRQQQQQQRLPPPPDIGQSRAPLGAPLGRWGAPAPAPASDEPPPVNSIHRGRVANIRPFGVFISIPGYRRDVLVHHTQVSDMVQLAKDDEDDMKVKALEFVAQRGQEVWVKVTEVTPDASGPGFRLHGSMIFVSQEDGRDLDPTGQLASAAKATGGGGPQSDEPPEEGSIHRATVKRIEPYGVFVALPGYKRYGLVHSSQVANYLDFTPEDTDEDKKRALAEVVGLGDTAWVKVVEVSPADEAGRGPKIGCSIKLVNQSDGTDLDPQGMRYRPRGEGGGGGGRGRGPIGADAGDVKGGKINWGYLAGEVKHYGDSKYDLLADDPGEGPRGPGGPSMPGGAPGAATNGGPPLPPALPPAGRGRGATLPAWMTGGSGAAPGAGPAAPGSLPGPPHMAPGSAAPLIRDVDEAMAILRAAAAKQKKSKHKKEKKKHKHKGEKKSRKSDKKHSKSKDRKERRGSRDRGSDSSSSSSGESSDSDRDRQR